MNRPEWKLSSAGWGRVRDAFASLAFGAGWAALAL
jgi:hypothetical protein